MSDDEIPDSFRKDPLGHYKRLLTGSPAARSPFESTEGPDLSGGAISARTDQSRSELNLIVKEFLGDDPELHKIADQITREGEAALRAVGANDAGMLQDPAILRGLEVIVRTDGSRPSFMVQGDVPNRATSPIGTWGPTFDDATTIAQLKDALQCICRIDDPSARQGFQGTGILVGRNAVVTNRHVLQTIASEQLDKSWKLKPNISVDFGHEFRARPSVGKRNVKGVLFSGAQRINANQIDHGKLDLALLELESAPAPPPVMLALDIASDWGQPETGIFICGYPGNPGFAEAPSLLEQLFLSTYGFKRVAPGLVTTAAGQMGASPRQWTLGHDATTLGGNSGSAVVIIGREKAAAGLHYGGRRADPRENWCHVIGLALDEPDLTTGRKLRDVLSEQGVQLKDRLSS